MPVPWLKIVRKVHRRAGCRKVLFPPEKKPERALEITCELYRCNKPQRSPRAFHARIVVPMRHENRALDASLQAVDGAA
jgi:hypothetical protein